MVFQEPAQARQTNMGLHAEGPRANKQSSKQAEDMHMQARQARHAGI